VVVHGGWSGDTVAALLVLGLIAIVIVIGSYAASLNLIHG
jgi:hypothetical protein